MGKFNLTDYLVFFLMNSYQGIWIFVVSCIALFNVSICVSNIVFVVFFVYACDFI